ncbi:hypothetical protein PN456_06125, partial [Nodularia spumigena CS-586/05]|uniref:hypothetical protein n=1 Tax=Nodularia spumigena TaxID=70799 RepID=UPI00232C2B4A
MPEKLKPEDVKRLIGIMAKLAIVEDDPPLFLRNLVTEATLPTYWVAEVAILPKNINLAATKLIRWAEAKGINPENT